MMKKVLLTALTGMMAYGVMGQVCTPDPSFNPNSPTGGIQDLPCAKKDVAYNEASTIVVPTIYEVTPGTTAYICKVRVDSVTNFPQSSSLNYAVWYNGTSYGPGQYISLNTANPTDRACVRVNGTFTALYNDSLKVYATVHAYGNQACTLPIFELPVSQIAGGPLKVGFTVDDDCLMSVGNLSNNSFDVAQNFPNPFTGSSQIAFNLPQAGKVVYRLTNLVGKTVAETNINGNVGTNYININSSDYAAGVYMYSVSFNGQTVTKRLIIK